MTKKISLVLVIVFIFTWNIFAKDNNHEGGDILLGLDIGANYTLGTDFMALFSVESDSLPKGNHGVNLGGGLHVDYYLNYWLSLSAGVGYYLGVYGFLENDVAFNLGSRYEDYLHGIEFIKVPVMAHVNMPFFQYLYAGAGVALNVVIADSYEGPNAKNSFFIGVPLDLGIDFTWAFSPVGARLFFRFTPEFYNGNVVFPLGLVFQLNYIFSR